jgi:hypothetical protein
MNRTRYSEAERLAHVEAWRSSAETVRSYPEPPWRQPPPVCRTATRRVACRPDEGAVMPHDLLWGERPIWLAVEPVDMRLGMDGLSSRIQNALGRVARKIIIVQFPTVPIIQSGYNWGCFPTLSSNDFWCFPICYHTPDPIASYGLPFTGSYSLPFHVILFPLLCHTISRSLSYRFWYDPDGCLVAVRGGDFWSVRSAAYSAIFIASPCNLLGHFRAHQKGLSPL